MQVLWSFVMVSTLDTIRRFWWLSSCGLVMYAGNHDLLCQVGNLNAKNGIESLLNSITSPPQCSPTHAGRIKRQYHKWQCEQHEERKVLTPRTEIWKWWRSREANMAKDNLRILRKRTFVVDIPPPAVPSKIIQEVIQRNANEIHQGPGSKESLKSSFNFCLLDKW